MSTDPRWTPEVERAMQAAYDEHTTSTEQFLGGRYGWRCMGCGDGRAEGDALAGDTASLLVAAEAILHENRAALAALADLGVLVPTGQRAATREDLYRAAARAYVMGSVQPLRILPGETAPHALEREIDTVLAFPPGSGIRALVDAVVPLVHPARDAEIAAARRDGWQRAVACLEGVVKRTGSISAKYWADYLRIDPDKERDREVPDA